MTSYKTYSDLELSVLLKEGDEFAYTEIYNRYWQTIYTIAYNRLRSMEAAQDLVHDTFASLWTNRQKVSIDNLKSYLGVIIKYRVIEYIRREKLANSYEQRAARELAYGTNDVNDTLHLRYILATIEKEIENLPDKCKLIFKYSRHYNKSIKEIANELNLSQSTVENQLNKALNRLKRTLKNLSLLFLSSFL
jgi:RNA polymerase sigma-70 factor (family 1)